MDFNKYCKKCGSPVTFQYGRTLGFCNTCLEEIDMKEAIAGYTKDARISQLKAMHSLMMNANDEGIYMTWIQLVPDCPMEEDFVSIALNDDEYNECFDLFVRLIKKDGNRY